MTTPWTGQWVSERLGITVAAAPVDGAGCGCTLTPQAIVGLALRDNPRRAHLLVSTVLGKHVPSDPNLVYGVGRLLGAAVSDALAGRASEGVRAGRGLIAASLRGDADACAALGATLVEKLSEPDAPWATDACDAPDLARPVVLGYAETATALGHCVAQSLGADYLHSTRRRHTGVASVAGFDEEHSHAVAHLLQPAHADLLADASTLVLVDDELSTGQTVLNTVRSLHARWPRPRYVIASLIDLRTGADRARCDALAVELGVEIDVVSLVNASVQAPVDVVRRGAAAVAQLARAQTMAAIGCADTSGALASPSKVARTGSAAPRPIIRIESPWPAKTPGGGRHGITAHQTDQLDAGALAVADALVRAGLPTTGRILVLGTEELMFAPLRVAVHLRAGLPNAVVRFSTTTRSPAAVLDDPGYALRSGLRFADPEGGPGDRFAYNISGGQGNWTAVVVITDEPADTSTLAAGLLARLGEHAGQVYLAVLPAGRHRTPGAGSAQLPEPLTGPGFGSYPAHDVRWLLTDLSDVALEAPTEDREQALQTGFAHYAESLPIEYQPDEEYQSLFQASLADSAQRIAYCVAIVTEIVLAERGRHAVLASLARAGTPVGILMRRWAAFAHGLDLAHYAVSIVRGRGIDEVALRYLAGEHDPGTVVFVDGWTGKGAIARELSQALVGANAALGAAFSPQLAVLADPGSCVSTFGTRADFLIPSACLNSTVSGLISRTVLNDELIGPRQFHGAKFYAELAAADVSLVFLDAITGAFASVATRVDQNWKRCAQANRVPTWAGWRAVEAISARYGIGDVNLVKPGVGETTRVLLRRVPEKVLMRPDARAGLAHIELLAAQRGVEIEQVPDLAYSCVGLIHPQTSRSATGFDGRAVRR